MSDERDRIARWTEPTSIEGADLKPEKERVARRAVGAWQRYKATGDRTELVGSGSLSGDNAASSEPAAEEIPNLARAGTVRYAHADRPPSAISPGLGWRVPSHARGLGRPDLGVIALNDLRVPSHARGLGFGRADDGERRPGSLARAGTRGD